jgi:hypothetical protein
VRFSGWQRKAVALAALAGLAGFARWTMGAGRPAWLVMILLGGFALRILLAGPGLSGPDRAAGWLEPDAGTQGEEADSQPGAGSRYHSDDGSGG